MSSRRIEGSFRAKRCTVFQSTAIRSTTGNSVLESLPNVMVHALFPETRDVRATCSLVRIKGVSGESLHYHSSHLVGLVVRGRGWLLVPGDDASGSHRRLAVTKGDVVVVPRRVLHLFECRPREVLEYLALEFSDEDIDYQKHFPG